MTNKEYKALFVKKATHKKVVVKAKQKEMTIDEYILSIIKPFRSVKGI